MIPAAASAGITVTRLNLRLSNTAALDRHSDPLLWFEDLVPLLRFQDQRLLLQIKTSFDFKPKLISEWNDLMSRSLTGT